MLRYSSSTEQSISIQGINNRKCKTLIRPVATYRAESWTLNKDIAKRLAAFELKVLRTMFGGITVN